MVVTTEQTYIPRLMPTKVGIIQCEISYFKNQFVLIESDIQPMQAEVEGDEAGPSHITFELSAPEFNALDSKCKSDELHAPLRNNIATLFPKMHSVLHVSESAIQDIVESLSQIFSLSKPLLRDSIVGVLQDHGESISDACLNDLVEAVAHSITGQSEENCV